MNSKNYILVRIFHLLVLTLLILPITIADDEQVDSGAFDPTTFDYQNGNYDSIDWSKADYSKVDWNKVKDWTKIPLDRIPEVPKDKIDFSKLNNDQKQKVTTEQLKDNLQKAGDLTKYNQENAKQAVYQRYSVVVTSFGTNPEMQAVIDENGFLVANSIIGDETKAFGSVPLRELSPYAEVRIDNNGRIIVEGETEPPAEGNYIASYPLDKSSNIQVGGRKGVTVQGQLVVKGKDLFVEKGAFVDGVSIPQQEEEVVKLFLDGKKHQD